MVREVVWNKKAAETFHEITEFIEENYSEESAGNFVRKVNELIEKLRKYPEIGRRSKTKKTVRQYKIDKYRKMYYRKYGAKLLIVYIFDQRQDPDSNPYL